MKKKHLLCILLVVALSSIGSCQNLKKTPEKGAPTIGVSINSLRSPFMIAMVQGIQDKGEELGINIIVSECNGDEQIQVNQILDFVVREVDAILMQPLDADAFVPIVEQVSEKGIPVFCIDTTANSEEVICWIGSDSLEMGHLAGHYIAYELYQKYGTHRGKVVDLLASLSSTSGQNRTKGFREVLEQYPDIEIVATQNGGLQLDQALDAMTDILQANSDIDAIWCSGDTNAQGVLRALERAGMLYPVGDSRHITLVSTDGAPESLKAIREGYLDACISQNPIGLGEVAVEMIYTYLTEGTRPENPVYAYPLFTINAANIDSEAMKEYGIWSEMIQTGEENP